ncbi:glycosyltransferase family 4 protein [Terrabacter aerolatus]|uniref:glycosyltransferase family 4 protein n=1 Tax=Terrabacter aerolatus TaxID=422442 RepID=UPI00353099BB
MVGPFPQDIGTPSGGVEAATVNLIHGIAKVSPQIEISVVAYSTSDSRTVVSHSFGEAIYVPQRSGFKGWRTDLHGELYDLASRESADIVHVQGLASVAIRLRKSVLTVHGMAERDTWANSSGTSRLPRTVATGLLEGLPRLAARRVISISQRQHQLALRLGANSHHIPNALHEDFFCAGDPVVTRDPSLLVQSGIINPLKRVHDSIKALRQIKADYSGAQIVFAGSGVDSEYGKYCVELARELGVLSAVHFAGKMSTLEMASLLRSAAVLVHPSIQENAPMAVAEALASGTAVVARGVGDIPNMLHQAPGCVVTPLASDLAGPLTQGLALYDDSQAAGRRSKAIRYEPSRVALETIEVYRSYATGKSSA